MGIQEQVLINLEESEHIDNLEVVVYVYLTT